FCFYYLRQNSLFLFIPLHRIYCKVNSLYILRVKHISQLSIAVSHSHGMNDQIIIIFFEGVYYLRKSDLASCGKQNSLKRYSSDPLTHVSTQIMLCITMSLAISFFLTDA
uniref:Uncharacterized protein n=1 Tax=Callorhinchus milii TaxID=7868 RepID=A0A4W3GF11_CALMI